MKLLTITIAPLFALLLLMACTDDEIPMVTPDPDPYTPFFDLGETLNSNANTTSETTTIIIDPESNYAFDIISTHNSNASAETFFIEVSFEIEDNIRFLNTRQPGGFAFDGPLLTVFDKEVTIDFDMPGGEEFEWFAENEIDLNSTGWIKYHIFTAGQGSEVLNFEEGDNYLVLKFGEPGDERLGWVNIFYEDTSCYVKEAYFKTNANEGIVTGEK